MRKITIAILSLSILLIFGCNKNKQTKSYNEGINIIPTPLGMSKKDGQFRIDNETGFFAESQEAKTVADFFASKMRLSTGYSFSSKEKMSSNTIALVLDEESFRNEEGYKLTVDKNKVEIVAKTPAGLFYGMQSLLQLLPAEIESPIVVEDVDWIIPCLVIKDEPRFEYRGFLLDVCRHFMPVESIKKQLDVLALFKINRFHWHLTEDQAWRIEIKKYPKLTEIGSKRIEGEGFEHGGFYTQEEIKDVVSYAAERFITVIPELEVPGHELAAIASYPELSCKGEQLSPRIIWGVEDIIMCAGKETTFDFLQGVIDELVTLFPSEYYHIGGDEAPKTSWKNCPNCQRRIKEENLKSDKKHTAEERLQSYVIQRVERMLAKHGKKIIGWDEILEGGIAPTATVMSWRGESGGIEAAMMNHKVIMTPASDGMYINNYQGDYKLEPVSNGGYSTLERVYNYNPVPDTLVKVRKASRIIGVQGNLWAEYIYSEDVREYKLYPRILALSEIAWSPLKKKNFEDFTRRLNNAYVRLDEHNINYHIPEPEQPYGSCNFVAFVDSAVLTFKTTRPIKMVYTLDGSIPNVNSTEYVEPIVLHESATLKICSILSTGKTSPIRNITVEKQTYAPAIEVADPKPGFVMKTTDGLYFTSEELYAEPRAWKESIAKSLRDLRSVVKSTEDMRGVKQYSAVGDGFVKIDEDGVYYFSSNNTEVWIDGKLLIDNNNEVKRFSRHDKSVALAKGFHEIKVVFLGHIIGGWPSLWDSAEVSMRKADSPDFINIGPEMLFHQ